MSARPERTRSPSSYCLAARSSLRSEIEQLDEGRGAHVRLRLGERQAEDVGELEERALRLGGRAAFVAARG